jgi:hypothetical protein
MLLNSRYDKTKLLARLHAEYDFAERTLALVPPHRVTETGVCGHWSVKDVVAHLTSWEDRTLRWLATAAQGIQLHVPEEGYGWNEFDRLNEAAHERTKALEYAALYADFKLVQVQMLATVEAMTDEELAGGGRYTGMFSDSPIDAIAANTCEHYELHLQQIRTWLAT